MFKKIQRITSFKQLKSLYPAKALIKKQRDKIIKDILSGGDKRRLLIIGPCSLDGEKGIYKYLNHIVRLQEKVKDKLFIVPRLYTVKPRSKGGFMGLIHSPFIKEGDCLHNMCTDMASGVTLCRKILSGAINDFGLSGADELLYLGLYDYFDDLISYYTIGARSSLNQEHRLFASGLNVPVGIKNPLNGSLSALADSIYVARKQNRLIKNGFDTLTDGNPFAHAVLRGFTNRKGNKISNFDKESVFTFNEECLKRGLSGVPVIIDASHDNSQKNPFNQVSILRVAAENMRDPDYSKTVRGFMLESYIFTGKNHNDFKSGLSITDECLGIEETEKAIIDLCQKL